MSVLFFAACVLCAQSGSARPQGEARSSDQQANDQRDPRGKGREVVVATSEGTDFWVCFMRNSIEADRDPITNQVNKQDVVDLQLFIAGSEDCKATIEIDGLLFKREVLLRGGTVVSVKIDTGAQMRSSEKIERLAIHVTATKPVSVYGLNHRFMTTDTYLGLPVTALGYEYRIMSYEKLRDDPLLISQFGIIATEDSTFVTINPTTPTLGGKPRGVPFSVLLKRGDAYNVIAAPGRRFGKADLTGTLIQSNKKIAVFGSHSGAYIPNNEKAGYNHLVEQMPPVAYWGRHYYVGMLAGCSRSAYRVLAAEGGTKVFANGQLVATLGAGEFYENNNVTENVQITADKRILVAQYSLGFKNGQGVDLKDSIGDPMMLLITPTQQFLKKYRIATPTRGQWHHYFNLVVPRGSMLSMKLDGKPLEAKIFKPFADSRYVFTQLEVPYGTHIVEGKEPFGLYSYGFGYDDDNYDAYGNMGGQAFLEWQPAKDTLAPLADVQQQGSGAKVVFHDDREIDKGLRSVRLLRADGLNMSEAQFTQGAPLAYVLAYPSVNFQNGSGLLEAMDIAGNKQLFTLCYGTDGSSLGTFSLVEGDIPACPGPALWYAGAWGTLAVTNHIASFTSVGGIRTEGTFTNTLGTELAFTGGGLLVGRKLTPQLGVSARLAVERFPGRINAPDVNTTTFRDSTRSFQLSELQQGSALTLNSTYLSLGLAAEWYFSPFVYVFGGFKAGLPVVNSIEFKRYIISPEYVRYANGSSDDVKFSGALNNLSSVVLGAFAGVGVNVPVWRTWSVAGEVTYSGTLNSVIADGNWLVNQVGFHLGVRTKF